MLHTIHAGKSALQRVFFSDITPSTLYTETHQISRSSLSGSICACVGSRIRIFGYPPLLWSFSLSLQLSDGKPNTGSLCNQFIKRGIALTEVKKNPLTCYSASVLEVFGGITLLESAGCQLRHCSM